MDFSLTSGQQALRDEARRFADEVVAPGAGRRDDAHLFPEEILQAAAERGYCGLIVPKEYGGRGDGNVSQALVLEEIARADASTHVTLSVHSSLVAVPILTWGSEHLKRKYLPEMAAGRLIGAYALTEPHSGSDAAALACTAVRDGDSWVLNGTKMWITTGRRADVLVVFARTDKDAPKTKGISAFVVDGASPGLTAGKKEDKLGIRASETVQIFFEDVRIPAGNLLGEPDRGFNHAVATLNGGRIGIATQALGIAQAALDAVMAAFGRRTPEKACAFGSQDQDFRIAEMAARIDAARLLVWRAAWLRDQGLDHVSEASTAKLVASQACNDICRDAVAILGAEGWRAGGVVERLLRDARITEIYEGTTEIQKLVIARHLKER